ncbi:MAG: phosphate/phosphite/phosphonate ABC transporter substrate-binding protein [Lautropia sp.]
MRTAAIDAMCAGNRTRRRVLATGTALAAAAGLRPVRLRAAPGDDAASPVHSVSVVPQFAANDIDRDWSPLLARLGERIGARLVLQVARTIPAFERALWQGTPDFAFMNPYHQVLARRAAGYEPLVRDARALSGILVTRADGPVRSLRDLEGREVAFPAPNAFGASLWMRALLAEREGLRILPRYVTTHGNVYRQVLLGLKAAGGGVNATLAQERPEVRRGLRVLLETPGVASHPIGAHPRVPLALRAAFADAMLSMAGDADAALLAAVRLNRVVPADYARDYAPLEAYHLDRYVVKGS